MAKCIHCVNNVRHLGLALQQFTANNHEAIRFEIHSCQMNGAKRFRTLFRYSELSHKRKGCQSPNDKAGHGRLRNGRDCNGYGKGTRIINIDEITVGICEERNIIVTKK
jgi:hypothetical protein